MAFDNAYQTSGKIFEQVSKKFKPGMLEELRNIEKGDIVVVDGTYDHVEKLLDTLKVPYERIDRGEMATYNTGRVMFVNCAAYNGVAKNTCDGIRHFVEDGGRLITTDWSLGLVTSVFPGKLKKTKDTGDDVVEIECPTDIARRFIGMNYAQCRPKWWLEGSSHIFNVVSDDVTSIITSDEMNDKYGQPHVAVGFREGRGEVLHFISHLELQRTKLKSNGDKGTLDDFLEKMKVEKTAEMDDHQVAELEAAYSTLNTVAYLCLKSPVLATSGKSTYFGSESVSGQDVPKSMKLA